MQNGLKQHISDRLQEFGVISHIDGDHLSLTFEGVTNRFRFEDGDEELFVKYKQAKDSHFDAKEMIFVFGSECQVRIIRLDNGGLIEDEANFSNEAGEQVFIQRAGLDYSLAIFDSEEYPKYFERIIKSRLLRKSAVTRTSRLLMRRPMIARYNSLLAISTAAITSVALERIRSCLVKLAIEKGSCWEIAPAAESAVQADIYPSIQSDEKIPRVTYDQNLANYYKVAAASPFASQSFLAFYHVLEYHFLRVAEESLHQKLRTVLNSPSFQTTADGLDKAISLIRRGDANDDETEMLRKVLSKFLSEPSFISFVLELESRKVEKNFYSRRGSIFGEVLELRLQEGHALSNVAKILKHVRNAIVHSSDRYSRDECHIPLTDSERVIAKYIPIIKYCAEHVIFGTAIPMSLNRF